MRKKILEKKLARLMAKKTTLAQRALASQDANEVRSINDALAELNAEITETQEEIAAIDAEEVTPAADEIESEQRSAPPTGAQMVNGNIVGNTIGTFTPGEQ